MVIYVNYFSIELEKIHKPNLVFLRMKSWGEKRKESDPRTLEDCDLEKGGAKVGKMDGSLILEGFLCLSPLAIIVWVTKVAFRTCFEHIS